MDPLLTQASLEDGRKRREEELRRARARTKILDQVRGVVQATFKDPNTPNRRARTESEEGQWSQKRGSSEAGTSFNAQLVAVGSYSSSTEAEIPSERASNALRKVFARPESF